jgi:signal peptidase I
MRDTTEAFGVFCLSSSTGLFLYWTMFLLSSFSRVQRFGLEIPNVNISTGVIGAVSVALFAFGIISLRSKNREPLMLARNSQGKVVSILRADYASTGKKAGQSGSNIRSAIKAPQQNKHLGTKPGFGLIFIVSGCIVALTTGCLLTGLAIGTFSPIMVVCSQSMQPTLEYGDLIVIRGGQAENVEVGDVIAFNVPSPYDQLAASPTVHRVVEKLTENGEVYFKTKGDSNPSADSWEVPTENVVGEYTQFKIPYVGSVALFFRTPLGVTFLIFAIASFFLYSYYKKRRECVG